MIDFGEDVGLLRGYSDGAISGTRAASVSGEYRFPFARVERGLGTFPAFVQWAHAAAFVDAGRAWNDDADGEWTTTWGGEVGVSLVAGYAYPFSIVVGAASRRDGGMRGWATSARIGRAF